MPKKKVKEEKKSSHFVTVKDDTVSYLEKEFPNMKLSGAIDELKRQYEILKRFKNTSNE